MKKVLFLLLLSALLVSCGEYHKIQKSNDYQLHYKKAVEYYNKGEYTKALSLFDGVRTIFIGTSKAQSIAYYRAFCNYNMKDYRFASELFKQFISTYPESPYAEECLYMVGYCSYLASPKPRLDQQISAKAINDLQLYLNRYPMSDRKEKINGYIAELQDKLAYKDYLSARNYYLREHYKAAVISLQNCLKDYPGSKYREEIMYMLFNSKYEMAVNSVEEKKLERYNDTKEEYYYFVGEYPESKYLPDLKKKYESVNVFLANYDFDD
ncbi:outer membrane protein assembly factor BamD [Porphyromonadaceae bacterium OttesenSCG-928-L07]|nr:outer membrane protein assembly factor BamD [Porphyromonadaceae bacterium OttesenSCG-928-L07]MDL2331103.1 outer membrane protein assembly factor BamD [Odoribacter sp. OttesenSCG-928-A06]